MAEKNEEEDVPQALPDFENAEEEDAYFRRMSVARDVEAERRRRIVAYEGGNTDDATVETFMIARFENDITDEAFREMENSLSAAKEALAGVIQVSLRRVPPTNELYEGSNPEEETKGFMMILKIEFDSSEFLDAFYSSEFRRDMLGQYGPLIGETGQIIVFDYFKPENVAEDDDFASVEHTKFLKLNPEASDEDVAKLIEALTLMQEQQPGLLSLYVRKAQQDDQFFEGYMGGGASGFGLVVSLMFLAPESVKSFRDNNAFESTIAPHANLFPELDSETITLEFILF